MHPHKLNNLDILGVPQHKYAKEAKCAHVFFVVIICLAVVMAFALFSVC